MDATTALRLIEALLILLDIAIYKAIRFISPPSIHDICSGVLDHSCKGGDVSISTVSSPSSNITVLPPSTEYDVFLSFRGEDTRENFTSHLYEALCKADIKTFIDHKLHIGDQISPVLLRTIEQAEISVIIFSEDYASSTWCMDELVHILQCRDKYGRIVVPVFYQVDPSNIRKQSGSFGDAFSKLKQRFKDNQVKVQNWIDALIQSTSLSGWDSRNIRPESKLITKIVKDVLRKLNRKSSSHVEGLVGIDHKIVKIEELLCEFRIVGIWGMGGIGKTTLAKALFHNLKAQFKAFSFVENVRERLARIGLDKLQEECLKELLKDEDINIYNMKSSFVKSRLRHKKILLILDDVDDSITAEDLTKLCDWFGEGSRIIITSRDMQVLKNASVFTTYHVPKLDFQEAIHLFSLKAFKQDETFQSYTELSKSVVDYCQGNPLALVVLGCFLYGRGKQEWEYAMEKLKEAPHRDIFNVLKLSFDGLDEKQKNLFLDLAFFLREMSVVSLNFVRHMYDLSILIDTSVLKERSLISVDENGFIEMHALVKEIGFEISRQQLISNPEKPTRLWRHEDIYQLFIHNKGTEAVRCISLDMSKIKRTTLKASDFQKMYNLIFLKIYTSDPWKPSMLNICEDLNYLPEELKFFCWNEYPGSSVPLRFCAGNLVHLEMPGSHLQQLWDGDQCFPNLQSINLNYSKYLTRLPDLCQAPNIEELNIHGCEKLGQIHSSSVLGKFRDLGIGDCRWPCNVNIGGTMKRTGSGIVSVRKYLDLRRCVFNEGTGKVSVCDDGSDICGIEYRHVRVPFILEDDNIESERLKLWTKTLASLLPFVPRVYWSDTTEFGNFKQYFEHHHDVSGIIEHGFKLDRHTMRVSWREESVKVGPLIREGIQDYKEGRAMQLEEEEEEEEEGGSNSSNVILTRVPNIITRWSLLKDLRLQERDISGNAGWSIPQVSILKSLGQSDFRESLQPQRDLSVCLGVSASHWCCRDFHVGLTPWLRVSRTDACVELTLYWMPASPAEM